MPPSFQMNKCRGKAGKISYLTDVCCIPRQDKTARVWRLPELVPVVTLTGHKRGVWSVEFSPVDQCVLTASGDKTIRIWALSDGSCLKAFEGHTASVLKVSFITRGTQIISAGERTHLPISLLSRSTSTRLHSKGQDGRFINCRTREECERENLSIVNA